MCLCLSVHPSPENEFRSNSRKADISIALWRKCSRRRDHSFFRREEDSRKNKFRFVIVSMVISCGSSSQETQHANFLFMSQMRKKRPWKFHKQANTIRTMCLERRIYTLRRRRVRPNLLVQSGSVVKPWPAKPQNREIRSRPQQCACSSTENSWSPNMFGNRSSGFVHIVLNFFQILTGEHWFTAVKNTDCLSRLRLFPARLEPESRHAFTIFRDPFSSSVKLPFSHP